MHSLVQGMRIVFYLLAFSASNLKQPVLHNKENSLNKLFVGKCLWLLVNAHYILLGDNMYEYVNNRKRLISVSMHKFNTV